VWEANDCIFKVWDQEEQVHGFYFYLLPKIDNICVEAFFHNMVSHVYEKNAQRPNLANDDDIFVIILNFT
jgi:hypothetical protein